MLQALGVKGVAAVHEGAEMKRGNRLFRDICSRSTFQLQKSELMKLSMEEGGEMARYDCCKSWRAMAEMPKSRRTMALYLCFQPEKHPISEYVVYY